MEDLTLISCSYNTPNITLGMLESFFTRHLDTYVFIVDNSTDEATAELLKQHNVPFIRNPKGVHIKSVDILLNHVKTKYALLVDTDIIFLKPHDDIFEKFKEMDLTLMGEICGDRGGKLIHNRVHPWHCFINVENIRNNNIHFYNESKQFSTSPKIYDVGCTFFSDVRENKLKVADARLHDTYYRHYEGMSWRTKRYGATEGDIDFDPDATHNNHALYQHGLMIERQYNIEISKYRGTPIKCKI